jgi:hypothetical protein
VSRYRVHLQTVASFSIEVDADDEDAALDVAFEEAPNDLCAQCSGWGSRYSMDLGEWGTEGFRPIPEAEATFPAVECIGDEAES